MRERLHVLLGEARCFPLHDPRPGADIRDRVLALALAGQILPRLARVLARQADLQHAEDAQGFVVEALDGVLFIMKAAAVSNIKQKIFMKAK